MFDQICQKKTKFLFKFYILLHAIVSSSFIVIFQKPNIFLEFVIELTLRLYLSPKASSCRKCDIFWVLAFCCWSKKREGEHFFIHFFYSKTFRWTHRLPFHVHLKSLITTSIINIFFFSLLHHFLLREHLVLTDLWYITSYSNPSVYVVVVAAQKPHKSKFALHKS